MLNYWKNTGMLGQPTFVFNGEKLGTSVGKVIIVSECGYNFEINDNGIITINKDITINVAPYFNSELSEDFCLKDVRDLGIMIAEEIEHLFRCQRVDIYEQFIPIFENLEGYEVHKYYCYEEMCDSYICKKIGYEPE